MENVSYKYGCLTVGFFFLAVISLILGYKTIANSIMSKSWPTVQGTIVASNVSSRWNPGGAKGFYTYYPIIRYKYKVNGSIYTNDRISYHRKSSDRQWANKIVAKYPKDSSVQVFYQLDDPQNSVLEPGAKFSLQTISSLIIFIISFAIFIYGYKRWRIACWD